MVAVRWLVISRQVPRASDSTGPNIDLELAGAAADNLTMNVNGTARRPLRRTPRQRLV
jgi:hypothetical protein